MNVIIWGAGNNSLQARYVCECMQWNIIFYVDVDERKQNSAVDGISVIAPEKIYSINQEFLIVMGTPLRDAFEQAKQYTENVISWDNIITMNIGTQKMPRYETANLTSDKLLNSRILCDRKELLKQISNIYENKNLIFAEIGVAFGDYSEEIMKICNPQKLYLIDAWEGERWREGKKVVENKFKDEIKREQVELLQGYSTDILNELEDGLLDVAYIDTGHSYKLTWDELVLCDKKVKHGGIIAGHDYVNLNHKSRFYYGVCEAVNRFCNEYNYEMIYITLETIDMRSFALRKL